MPEEWVKFKQQQTGFTHKHHKRNWQGKERTSLVCIVQSLRSFVSSQEYRVGAPALTKCKALAIKWKHVFLKMQENIILFGCVLMTLWAPRHLFLLKADLGQDRNGEDTVLQGPSKRFFNLGLRHLLMTPKGQNIFSHLILRCLDHQKRSVKLLLLVEFHLQIGKKLIFLSKNPLNIKKKSGKIVNSKHEQHFAENMHNMYRIRTGLLYTNNLV